jgi:hypothetical protein
LGYYYPRYGGLWELSALELISKIMNIAYIVGYIMAGIVLTLVLLTKRYEREEEKKKHHK